MKQGLMKMELNDYEGWYYRRLKEKMRKTYINKEESVYIITDKEFEGLDFLNYEKSFEAEIKMGYFGFLHKRDSYFKNEVSHNRSKYGDYFIFVITEEDHFNGFGLFKFDAYSLKDFDVERFDEMSELKELMEEAYPRYFEKCVDAYEVRDEIFQEWQDDKDGIGLRYWWYINRDRFIDDE